MVAVYTILLLFLALFYAAVMGRYALGFRRVQRGGRPRQATPAPGAPPFVSVVVPARNEAASIAACVTSILANDYPAGRFEVIVVDDGSSDATAGAVRDLQARYSPAMAAAASAFSPAADEPEAPLRLLSLPDDPARDRAHKKHALEQGIARARGALVLSTDADCVVPRTWIRTMASYFDADTAFVSGPVLYPPGQTVFSRMQALEFLGLVAVGAGAIGVGSPNLCNGANVAYRRAVFTALGGYSGIDHLTSGDDELLMQKIAYTTAWQVRFCADPAAAVHTDPAPTLRAFFEQRRRWASKGLHYPRPRLVAMLLLIYLFYVLLLAGFLAAPLLPGLLPALAAALGLKMLAEAALLLPACRHFGRARLFRYFVPEQLVQIPYVVLTGLAGTLGGYRWKGRRIAR